MTIKQELKRAITTACPGATFLTRDGCGTPKSPAYLHVRLPREEVPALERAARAFGTRAVWPCCSEIYGAVRQILIPKTKG